MGGRAMADAGVEIEQSSDGLAVMGFIPVLKRLPEFIALGKHVEALIRRRRPKVLVTIDYPGFNLRMLKQVQDLRSSGMTCVHVVAPQVWAWKPRRAKKVAKLVDRLACFFPFEPPLFARHGLDADFVGHPLVDDVQAGDADDIAAVEQEIGLAPDDDLVVLAPGSREREVASVLPLFDQGIRLAWPRLRNEHGHHPKVVVSVTPENDHSLYRAATDLPLSSAPYRTLIGRSRAACIASGTATLEAALLGTPHVIGYMADPVSARIARHLLLTDHVGLPNIVHLTTE